MNDETKNDIDGVEVSVEVVEEQAAKSKSKKRGNRMKGSRYAG